MVPTSEGKQTQQPLLLTTYDFLSPFRSTRCFQCATYELIRSVRVAGRSLCRCPRRCRCRYCSDTYTRIRRTRQTRRRTAPYHTVPPYRPYLITRTQVEACTACLAGTYTDSLHDRCIACTAGYECSDPTLGKFVCGGGSFSTNGSVACTSCPAGSFCTSSFSAPQACGAGNYSTG